MDRMAPTASLESAAFVAAPSFAPAPGVQSQLVGGPSVRLRHGGGSLQAAAVSGVGASEEAVLPSRAAACGAALGVSLGAFVGARRSRRCRVEKSAAAGKGSAQAAEAPSQAWSSALLLLASVFADVGLYAAGERASAGFSRQTLLVASTVVSAIVASLLAVVSSKSSKEAFGRLKQCANLGSAVSLMPIALCLYLAQFCLLRSFDYFDAAFVKLLGQLKLPLSAFLSSMFLGRAYKSVQWQALFLLAVSCASFVALRLGTAGPAASLSVGSAPPTVGFALVAAWIVLNVGGMLLAEKALKRRSSQPFSVVIANLKLGELLAVVAMMLLVPQLRITGSFFHGWDWSAVAMLTGLVADTWLVGLVARRLSGVTSRVAKSFTLVVLYGLALATGRQTVGLPQLLGALLILQSTTLFATASMGET